MIEINRESILNSFKNSGHNVICTDDTIKLNNVLISDERYIFYNCLICNTKFAISFEMDCIYICRDSVTWSNYIENISHLDKLDSCNEEIIKNILE